MNSKKKGQDREKQARILADVRRDRALRQQGYREQALALYPHICGRCGREFSGKNLRELTVHHKDNDHMNNPLDGSNWELLCLYCHDDEHQRELHKGYQGGATLESHTEEPLGFRPFDGLKNMLEPETDDSDSA